MRERERKKNGMCNFLICDCFVGNFGLTGFLFYVLEFLTDFGIFYL